MITYQTPIDFLYSFSLMFSLSLVGPKLKHNIFKYCLSAIVVFIILFLISAVFPDFVGSEIEPYFSITFMVFIHKFIFKTRLIDSLFRFVTGTLLLTFVEGAMLLIFTLIYNGVQTLFSNLKINAVFAFILLILVIIIVQVDLFRNLANKHKKLTPYVIIVCFNAFVFIQLVRLITAWTTHDATVDYVYLYLLYLLMFVANILLIRLIIKTEKEVNQIEEYKNYEALVIPLIDNSRAIEHDFKNHLSTLKALSNSNVEIDNYIESMDNEINKNNHYKNWNNPVIGALIQEKYREAENNGIVFEVENSEPEDSTDIVAPYHIISVLSNLIDNAFEEVQKLEIEKRCVKLDYRESTDINIEITNPLASAEAVKKIGKARFSTKGKSRGYGLSNIKKIVKEYNGDIEIEHVEDTIIISVVLKTHKDKILISSERKVAEQEA